MTTTSHHKIPDRYIREYTDKHWGNAPDFIYSVEDGRLPPYLVELGKILEIECGFLTDDGEEGTLHIEIPEEDRCILAYDKYCHRLYVLYHAELHTEMRDKLWLPDQPTTALATLAREVEEGEGRHAQPGRTVQTGKYPAVQVQSLGFLRHVIYFTNKKRHGPSRYIHEFGEVNGLRPDLCISEDGQLWYAGGDYWIERHGIIN